MAGPPYDYLDQTTDTLAWLRHLAKRIPAASHVIVTLAAVRSRTLGGIRAYKYLESGIVG